MKVLERKGLEMEGLDGEDFTVTPAVTLLN
jgi:hypothetical protein